MEVTKKKPSDFPHWVSGEKMDIDSSTLISVVFGYKHLWLKYQELRYLSKHPHDDPEIVREAVFDEVDDLFRPVGDALSEGQPV